MKAVFADTYYFIALFNPSDRDHAKATAWTRAAREEIVTTEFVLLELADGMAQLKSRDVVMNHPPFE